MANLEIYFKQNQKDVTVYQVDNITIQINNLIKLTSNTVLWFFSKMNSKNKKKHTSLSRFIVRRNTDIIPKAFEDQIRKCVNAIRNQGFRCKKNGKNIE